MPPQQEQEQESSVPGDVNSIHQLVGLPDELLNYSSSGCNDDDIGRTNSASNRRIIDCHRPLLHTDANGTIYTYALNPLYYSVYLILVLELLERFSFYGLYMTQTNFLTGSYDEDWNAGLTSMDAASLVSLSTAMAYTAPFLGGMLADKFLGDYKTILVGFVVFYLPGVFVIASSTTPTWWLGKETFNVTAYKLALLVLWPLGTGTVKAVVNIFGARQYHPILQRSMIESFYVRFYMIINVGACLGFIIMPIVARHNITIAYIIPLVLLLIALVFFVAGSTRYVNAVPGKHMVEKERQIKSSSSDEDNDEEPNFLDVAKICLLIVPFCIVYQQAPTTFMVQGAVMDPFLGFIEAPSMDILDTFSVLICGYFVSSHLYPYLATNNIKFATGYKFALGCAFAACAILWTIFVESMIHVEFARTGGKVNVVWTAPSYILIGAGELFAISACYEVAFTTSPANKKAFACAFNLFCIGGVPSLVSLALFRICGPWFRANDGSGNIGTIEKYSEAKVGNYFWVLFWIIIAGLMLNIYRPVVKWINTVEQRAANALSRSIPNTPKTPRSAVLSERKGHAEADPLLKAKKQIKYLEEDACTSIYRANTPKAGFSKKKSRPKKSKNWYRQSK